MVSVQLFLYFKRNLITKVIETQYSSHYCKKLNEQANRESHLLVNVVVRLCSQRKHQKLASKFYSQSMQTDCFLFVFMAKTHTAVCCSAFGHREASPHSSLLRPFSVCQKSWSIVQSQAVLSSTISPFIMCRLRQFPCRATLDPEGFLGYFPRGYFC